MRVLYIQTYSSHMTIPCTLAMTTYIFRSHFFYLELSFFIMRRHMYYHLIAYINLCLLVSTYVHASVCVHMRIHVCI